MIDLHGGSYKEAIASLIDRAMREGQLIVNVPTDADRKYGYYDGVTDPRMPRNTLVARAGSLIDSSAVAQKFIESLPGYEAPPSLTDGMPTSLSNIHSDPPAHGMALEPKVASRTSSRSMPSKPTRDFLETAFGSGPVSSRGPVSSAAAAPFSYRSPWSPFPGYGAMESGAFKGAFGPADSVNWSATADFRVPDMLELAFGNPRANWAAPARLVPLPPEIGTMAPPAVMPRLSTLLRSTARHPTR